jgi:hypothetical protein
MGDLPTHILTVVYFLGWPAHMHSLWSIFFGDLPTHTLTLVSYYVLFTLLILDYVRKSFLIEWYNNPKISTTVFARKLFYFNGWPAHTLALVYFHGRLTYTHSPWSIFMGDLPTHTHSGLFSSATFPYTHSSWSIFMGNLPTHTHPGLFLRVTCPFKLQKNFKNWSHYPRWPTHLKIQTLIYFHGRPTHLNS